MMNRRTFLCGLTLGTLSVPLAGEAQQAARRVPRIGYLAEARLPAEEAFLRGLRELGYIDGQNIAIEYRYRRAGSKELGDLAVELVGLKVDLIVAVATPATRAAKQTTSSIPIVMVAPARASSIRVRKAKARARRGK
jgi:putative ABC transport system substrate-binding protein